MPYYEVTVAINNQRYGTSLDQTDVAVVHMYVRHDRGGGTGFMPMCYFFNFFLLCNSSHDSTVKNAVAQRYHFKHGVSQEPQILSVELNEDML